MLLAYIDEIGEPGAFVSPQDRRYNTSPAFGYAGFIVPADKAREFGAHFAREKGQLFKSDIASAEHPGRWEKKGAEIFRPNTPNRYPEQLRVFDALIKHLKGLGGQLFYYANEKPLGTPKQTDLVPEQREAAAMQETLNRIARHANEQGSNVMVMIDQINEKTRAQRLPNMYGHILGRASDFREMRRIIEPPMHIDSQLSSNIQFADWVAACVSRAIDYQLVSGSKYRWVTDSKRLKQPRGAFTHESKVHLYERATSDLHHSAIFQAQRKVISRIGSNTVGGSLEEDAARRIQIAVQIANAPRRNE